MPVNRRNGFTIAEVVVVLVIIAIIAVIATPHYASAVSRQRLDAACRRFVADVELAQRLARTTSMKHRVRFLVTGSKYYLEKYDGSAWVACPSLDRSDLAYEVDLSEEPYGAAASFTGAGGRAFVFDGYGQATADRSVRIRVGKRTRMISLWADTGEITIVDLIIEQAALDETPALDPAPSLPGL